MTSLTWVNSEFTYFYIMKQRLTGWLATLSLILAFSLPAYSQKSAPYVCFWQSGQSFSDGEEFINKMRYDDKSKFLYYVSNDEKDLYITLLVSDRAAIQKIMRYGLTTWFNPDARHKKSLGIQFPVPGNGMSGPPSGAGKPVSADRKEMMNRMLEGKNNEVVLIGFSGKGEKDTVMMEPVYGVRGKLNMPDREKMILSLIVPIEKIESSVNGEADGLFSMGFETGYLDLNQAGIGQASGSQPYDGGHGGGMYGGPPSGGGAPASAGSGQATPAQEKHQGSQAQVSISELSKPNKLWISQVKLAKR